MSIIKQDPFSKGSLKDIQLLINVHPNLLNALLECNIPKVKNIGIDWLSPVKKEDYAEYCDKDFIKLLGLKLAKPLNGFWPQKGPQWDALGKSKNGLVFLVEAKANIPEMVSPSTQASAPSKKTIDAALADTKKFLNITNDVDWSGKFYQYTNRLAYLYFLREQNGVPAYLVNIYFINDKEVNGPESKKEWLAAIKVMKCYLGVSHHKLSKYMIDLFIDVEDLRKIK